MLLSRHFLRRSAKPFHRFIHRGTSDYAREFASGPRPLSVLLDIPALDPEKAARKRKSEANAGRSMPAAEDDIELFDAIVHDGVPAHKMRTVVSEACVLPNGSQANIRVDEKYSDEIAKAYESGEAQDAFLVLCEIIERGFLPTARAFIRVVETCASAGDFELAEHILEDSKYSPYIGKYEREEDVKRSAVTSIALAYLSHELPRGALRILGWDANAGVTENIDATLEEMNLEFCEMSWGCLIRALTKTGESSIAVDVAHAGFKRGVASSPALIFFMLEALRGCGRWKDADALLQATIERLKSDYEDEIELSQERLIGSVLRTLTAPAARRFVNLDRVVELTNSIAKPSLRFRTVSLIALCSVGRMKEARSMYDEIVKDVAPDRPDERALSVLVGGYSACVEIGPPDHTSDVGAWYESICAEVDAVWKEYQTMFPDMPTSKRSREARSRAFQRVLWTKSRSMKAAECVDELAEVCSDKWMKKACGISTAHFAAILSGTELTCDTETLGKLITLMENEGIMHDPRTLAFVVGTLLGAGDSMGALGEVRKNGAYILAANSLVTERDYRVSLLVRRLEMLEEAVTEKSSKIEIKGICSELKNHLRTHKGPTKGWR